MIYPLAALFLLWLALSRSGAFPRLVPTMAPGTYEKLASVAAVAVALLVLVRGNVWAALAVFGVALWLLGRASRRPSSAARTHMSRVRSAMIEMDFDQARARMTGRIIAGPYEGNALDRLDQAQCETILGMCRRDDPDGARLLEAYLHRRFAGWRPAGEAHADARSAWARGSSRMSEDEAYEVLGLRRGAARDEVVRAHRAVMKKWHPDQGGTADLAARANEAKEILLRRHA